MVGGIFEWVGYALPFAYAVDAAKALLSGASIAEVATQTLWVVAYAIVCFALAVLAFGRAMKIE